MKTLYSEGSTTRLLEVNPRDGALYIEVPAYWLGRR